MAFGPGCYDVRTHRTYAVRGGSYGRVRLAVCSHMRSTPEHDVPTSAQTAYETLTDKSSCRARFYDHFCRLNALWSFAQCECPIHFREFPVSTALPQRFCKNGQTSILFRLGAINFHLRLHGRHSACALLRSTRRCAPLFRAVPCQGRGMVLAVLAMISPAFPSKARDINDLQMIAPKLSFPKIISGRSDDVVRTELAWQR